MDFLNIGTGGGATGGIDTIYFGTSFTGDQGTGNLHIAAFSASGGDVLDLSQLMSGNSATGIDLTGYDLDQSGGTGADFDGLGSGVISVHTTGSFDIGDITASGGSGSNLYLSTGDVDYFIIVGTGAGDANVEIFHVNASRDGTGSSFSASDIYQIGQITFTTGMSDLTASNFDLS